MARQKITVLSCDVCGRQDADTWRITPPGQPAVELDLCGQHSQKLRELAAEGRPARSGRAARRPVERQPVQPPPPGV